MPATVLQNPFAKHYVVLSGDRLSRRLVEAGSPEDALQKYLSDSPIRPLFKREDQDLEIREATETEVSEFQKWKRAKHIEGQTAFELDDARKTAPTRGRAKKEHA